jgi:hypothetical protein
MKLLSANWKIAMLNMNRETVKLIMTEDMQKVSATVVLKILLHM